MHIRPTSHLALGAVFLLFALLLIFIWIPLDVETGITEKERRRIVIGDAFAPLVAGCFIALGALGLLLFERNSPDQPGLSRRNLRFMLFTVGIIVASLLIIRYAGPVAVFFYNALTESTLEYRLLRDTPPWKYLGFITGGTILIAGLISFVQGRITWKSIGIAVLSVLLMVLVYDIPFEDLLLPPNGDV